MCHVWAWTWTRAWLCEKLCCRSILYSVVSSDVALLCVRAQSDGSARVRVCCAAAIPIYIAFNARPP